MDRRARLVVFGRSIADAFSDIAAAGDSRAPSDRLDRSGGENVWPVGAWLVVGLTGSVFSFRSSPNIFNNLVIITSAVLALASGKP